MKTEIERLKDAARVVAQWSRQGTQQRWYSDPARRVTAYVIEGVWRAEHMPTMHVLASLIDGRHSVEERRVIVNALRRIRAAHLEKIV